MFLGLLVFLGALQFLGFLGFIWSVEFVWFFGYPMFVAFVAPPSPSICGGFDYLPLPRWALAHVPRVPGVSRVPELIWSLASLEFLAPIRFLAFLGPLGFVGFE